MTPWTQDIADRVVRAYREKGLAARPWSMKPRETMCCCAIGALIYDPDRHDRAVTVAVACQELGATTSEVNDFTEGFDVALGYVGRHLSPHQLQHPLIVIGFEVGKRVIAEGLVT